MIAHTHGRTGQNRTFVAGIWLLGLGLVFLTHDLADMTWAEAWPLFIILIGCGALASALTGYRGLTAGVWSLLWPLAWIAVGIVLFLSTTGRLAVGPAELVSTWWPAALIAIGAWFLVAAVWPGRTPPNETLAIPLAGAASAAVRINFGAGDLTVERGAPESVVSGTFSGGVVCTTPGPGTIQLDPYAGGGWPFGWDHRLQWHVGLTDAVPLDLRVQAGASRSSIDLGDLRVRQLDLQTGASGTRVMLPRAAGATTVAVRTGAASVMLEIPAGVAARIRSRMALGSTSVDQARFPRTADGYESPDYATAPNRVDIDVQGGVGAVRIG